MNNPMFYKLIDRIAIPATSESYYSEPSERRVGDTNINRVRVSTVFLGVNHQYGDGLPLLFESMAFNMPCGDLQERCSTWQQAEVMHEAMCEKVRKITS